MTAREIRAANTPYVDPDVVARNKRETEEVRSRTRRNCVRWTLPAKPLALTWTRINAPRFVLSTTPDRQPWHLPICHDLIHLGSGRIEAPDAEIQRVDGFVSRAQGLTGSQILEAQSGNRVGAQRERLSKQYAEIDEIVNGTTGPEGIEAMRAAIKAALESSPQAASVARPVQSPPNLGDNSSSVLHRNMHLNCMAQ